MARWYTRAEQRVYRDERRAQAKLVANRLMGKKIPSDPLENLEFEMNERMKQAIDNMRRMSMGQNILVSNPRTSYVISGMEGV